MDKVEILVKANLLADKLTKERDQLKHDLIKTCNEYKHYFETNWDIDTDLLSGDQERDHYRWVITKLQELLEYPYPNYIGNIDDHENQLPY